MTELPKKLVGTLLSRKTSRSSTRVTLISTFTISFITILGWYFPRIGSQLPVSGASVFVSHEFWRPWTACFAHADVAHLLSNLILFVIFGKFLSGHFGRIIFPVWAITLGGFANLIVLPSYPPELSVLGASGVVNVMGGMWLSLFFLISRQYRMPGRIIRTLGVALLLFAPQEFRPDVAERVHGTGLLLGLFFGSTWFLIFKHRIRSFEVWETIAPDDPGDNLPPAEGVQSES